MLSTLAAAMVCVGCHDSHDIECTAAFDALGEYMAENQACEHDGDCMRVHDECMPRAFQVTCCGTYLNTRHDGMELEALLEDTTACGLAPGPEASCGGCCLELSPPPVCRDGRCVRGEWCGRTGEACTSDDACCPEYRCTAGTCELGI